MRCTLPLNHSAPKRCDVRGGLVDKKNQSSGLAPALVWFHEAVILLQVIKMYMHISAFLRIRGPVVGGLY